MRNASLAGIQQMAIGAEYDGVSVGKYVADLLVENAVLVEVKAVKSLAVIYDAQCLNYLKATGLKVCLLLNFASAPPEVRRRVMASDGPRLIDFRGASICLVSTKRIKQ